MSYRGDGGRRQLLFAGHFITVSSGRGRRKKQEEKGERRQKNTAERGGGGGGGGGGGRDGTSSLPRKKSRLTPGQPCRAPPAEEGARDAGETCADLADARLRPP